MIVINPQHYDPLADADEAISYLDASLDLFDQPEQFIC